MELDGAAGVIANETGEPVMSWPASFMYLMHARTRRLDDELICAEPALWLERL